VEKTGTNRPWKSQERFPLSHSYNNNKLDDRDHFQQNAKTSVASLRGLIGSSRNIDRHHSGMLIAFIGIPSHPETFHRMAIERFKCCENIKHLAKELGVARQTLYRWHTKSECAEEGQDGVFGEIP